MKLRTYVLQPETYIGVGNRLQLRAKVYAREQWGDVGEERDLGLPPVWVELGPESAKNVPITFRTAINQAFRSHYEAFWTPTDDIDGQVNNGFERFLQSKEWKRIRDN